MKMVRKLMKKRTKTGKKDKKAKENMMQMVKNIMITTNNKMKVHMTMMQMARNMKKDKRDMRILTNIIHRNSMKMKKVKENISMVGKKKVKSLLKLPNKNTMLCTRFFNSLRVPHSTHTCNSSRTHNQLRKYHM